MQPLEALKKIDKVEITTAVDTSVIISNILDAKKRNLTPIYDNPAWREEMPIAIVGGGPSLSSQLDNLRKYKYIMACGSVHDYLIENNIMPTWCIICDPDPLMLNYLKKIQLNCQYLIASQCAPELFDRFIYIPYLGYKPKVFMWHCGGDKFDPKTFGDSEVSLGGGCTVGTRAMVMALSFGYNIQHLFGFDTCLDGDKHHAYEFNDPNVETVGHIVQIQLEDNPDSKKFLVAGYMLGQFFDFKNLLGRYANKIKVTIYGDGLLKHLMDIAIEKSKDN